MTTPAATDPARWRQHPPERFGLMSGYVWATDPKRILFVLARYKFVAKLLAGKGHVLEIGCGDAFGTRLVAQTVEAVTAIDFDREMLLSAQDVNENWRVGLAVHNILDAPTIHRYESAYAIDVLEHVWPADEDLFLRHTIKSVEHTGLVILGTPSLESQAYASEASREGHVNCKTMEQLRALCARHFESVLMFGMNDELVHTGYGPMCHYLWAICWGPKA